MESSVIHLSLLSRSLGPSCSNVEHLFMGKRRRLFRAYGVPGGAILVQRLPVSKSDQERETVTTEIVIDNQPSTSTNCIEDVGLLAYNHAETCLLAAASETELAVYSLSPFHQKSPSDVTSLQSPLHHRLFAVPFPGIVAMKWTGNGEGLILSDTRGRVMCMAVTVHHSPSPSSLEKLSGSLETVWVHRFKEIQGIMAAGDSSESAVAVLPCRKESVQIIQPRPSQPDPRIYDLPSGKGVTGVAWSRMTTRNVASMRPCLLTVEADGVMRIWAEAPHAFSSYLGSTQLPGIDETEEDFRDYRVEVVLEMEEQDYVIGSMQATWVDASCNTEVDPRLAWIVATYLVERDGSRQECCAFYVVHGLPVELEGTQISCCHVSSFLRSALEFGECIVPRTALCGVLLRLAPTPRILIAESGWQESSADTRCSLVSVEQTSGPDPILLNLENSVTHEIAGFSCDVRQLAMHPKHDCVCVVTEDLTVSVWDLWPIRKLCDVPMDASHIGKGIYAVQWLELECRYGELGYLLALGEQGAVISLIQSGHHKTKPAPSIQISTQHLYSRSFYPLSVTQLQVTSTPDCQKLSFLIRGQDADPTIDDEQQADVYWVVSIDKNPRHDITLQLSEGVDFSGAVEASSFTVLDQICQSEGGIVVGTCAGTLEFFCQQSSSTPSTLLHMSSCPLSTGSDHPSFISCLSACAHAPYIMCVTSFDEHQNEDKIHILQSESMCGGLNYRMEDSFVSPCGIISQISWVQTAAPFLSCVIGYQAGQVDVMVRKRQGLWVPVGRYVSSLEMTLLGTTRRGLPVAGAGRHMLFLSMNSHSFNANAFGDNSIMQAALTVGGAFPDFHHVPLLALLQLGHIRSIAAAVKEMVDFLRAQEQRSKQEPPEELFAPTINGPTGPLEESYTEVIGPPLDGLHFGEIVCREPFTFRDPSPATAEAIPKGAVAGLATKTVHQMDIDDTGLLTGQFDFTQFSMNNFTGEESMVQPKRGAAFEDSGLLDMAAFGMGIAVAPSSETEEDLQSEAHNVIETSTELEILHAPEENYCPERLGELEECVLLTTDASFDKKCQETLKLDSSTDVFFEREYMYDALKKFAQNLVDPSKRAPALAAASAAVEDEVIPIGGLLKLSKNSAGLLADVLLQYSTWTSDLAKMTLDVPGMKLAAAVKLSALANRSQPKRTESKNNFEEFKREDYVSPFLNVPSQQSRVSEASLASEDTGCSIVDERLTRGYISWPESVGMASGIEAIHLLWALESEDPHALLNACLDNAASTDGSQKSKPMWERLREIGAGFWIRDHETALKVADEVAKEQFRRRNDPHDCALLYVALKKQNLLSRLFRSNGHPRVADLLAKDFSQVHNQETAAKNAFVLLGQHRYSLAAALFLVGRHYEDAIGVCAKEMHDPQLALFLAAILDEVDAKMIKSIIMKEIFPQAVAADDRVAQGLLFWLMDDRMEALKAITTVKALKSELSIVDRTVSKILLVQFVLWRGLAHLSGRFVPMWMLTQIKNVVAHCAHVLEACGMPSLALKALQVWQELESQLPGLHEDTLYSDWKTRLVTSMMMSHLPSSQAVNTRDPSAILWHQRVQQDVNLLDRLGVAVDGDSILQRMQHVMDCLYEIPSAPIFPRCSSHSSDLKGGKLATTSPIPLLFRPPDAKSKITAQEEEGEDDYTTPVVSNIVVPESNDLLHVDGDRCMGVCFSRDEGFFGMRNPATKRVAVATAKHGIHYIDWDPIEQTRGFTTYHALYAELEKRRWPSLNWLKEIAVLDKGGLPISTRDAAGGPLKSHPSSNFFLSGCGEDSILLWEYGMGGPCARFGMQSNRGSALESIHRFCWSGSGDRLAAVGNGGVCGLWDIASAHYSQPLVAPGWSKTVARRGHDIEFVDGSGSVIATSGEDESGRGVFSLWDTLAPQSSCRIAHLEYRNSVTELAVVPGTLIFISAQDSGTVQAHDFRKLGAADGSSTPLWSLNSIHDGPITCLEVGWGPSTSPNSFWELTLATGGRDGDICLVNGITESGHLAQRLHRAHWKKGGQLTQMIMNSFKGSFGNLSVAPFGVQRRHSDATSGAPVMDLEWCDEGLLSSGADGFVQLFPFSGLSSASKQ